MIRNSILNKFPYRLLFLSAIFVLLVTLYILFIRLLLIQNTTIDDFTTYWAAGRLNFNRGNPYDGNEMLLQFRKISPDFTPGAPLVMLYPPWILSIVMPLSILNLSLSRVLWLCLNTFIILISADRLWVLYLGSRKRWISIFLTITAVPVFFNLKIGNITAFVLLGVVGFLSFYQDERKDFLSGLFVALCMIKPHVIYLLFLALFLWIYKYRRWKILLGFFLTLLVLTITSLIINPNVLSQYLMGAGNYSPIKYSVPTIGAILRRFIFGWNDFWLQYIAPVIGVIWFVYYWLKHRQNWQWLEQVPLLLLVSFITAAYAWSFDQVILIPVIIQVFTWFIQSKAQLKSLLLVVLYILIQISNMLTLIYMTDFWTIWVPFVLLIWFYLAFNIRKSTVPLAILT